MMVTIDTIHLSFASAIDAKDAYASIGAKTRIVEYGFRYGIMTYKLEKA